MSQRLSQQFCYFGFVGAALNIDPRQFYTQLYGAILQLDTCEYTLKSKFGSLVWNHILEEI